jgi:fucose 4-O-acetylase-like acetyltransferase
MKTLEKQQPLSYFFSKDSPVLYRLDSCFSLWYFNLLSHRNVFCVLGLACQKQRTDGVLEIPMEWLHLWRLPLLFFISGVGVSFAMKSKTASAFIGERSKRLLIPLLFGVLVIVPPQVYFERLQRHQFEGSYWAFYPKIFEFQGYPEGNSSWHHLWFIVYLWVFSVLATPLFVLLKNKVAKGSGSFFKK